MFWDELPQIVLELIKPIVYLTMNYADQEFLIHVLFIHEFSC